MMRHLYLFFFFSSILSSQAQIESISVGMSYSQFTYYSIKDGSTTSYDHTVWDIAFGAGGFSTGVFVNEGVGSSFSAPLPQVELYDPFSIDFDNVDTSNMERIYNPDVSWEAGAFNSIADSSDPFDLGWGAYVPSNNSVQGGRVFVIKLRNGEFKKIMVESLVGGVFTFKYANLDGSDEVSQTVAKADYAGKTLAYFSLENNEALDLEPDSWDLLFTRYATPLDDGAGGVIDYNLTGVLSNAGVEVAQASGINPLDVDPADYDNSYVDSLEAIGWDWKEFDFVAGWILPDDLAYFVKTTDSELWKLQFIDFEGSSTGVTILEKTFVETIVSAPTLTDLGLSISVFPNPTSDQINIHWTGNFTEANIPAVLVNNLGQVAGRYALNPQDGNSSIQINHLPTGLYRLVMPVAGNTLNKTISIQR